MTANLSTAAANAVESVIIYRAKYIQTTQDIKWYVSEEDGLSERDSDAAYTALVAHFGL